MNRIRLASAGYAVFAVAVFAWASCKSDRIDSHCTPDAPSYAADPNCIYSANGEEAAFKQAKCAPNGDAGTPAKPAMCPLPADVMKFFTDPNRGNCTAAACHGSVTDPAAGIFLNPSDPQQFFETLTTTTGTVGTNYVVPGATAYDDSWILCSVTGKVGGGYPMPPESGVPNYADAQIVSDWLLCGANGLQ